jgi:hypothetical protein
MFVVDDSPMLRQDPCFSFKTHAAGVYQVEITTVGASADTDSYYGLHLGHFPRPSGVFPLGGELNTQLAATFSHDTVIESIPPLEPFVQDISLVGAKIGTNLFEIVQDGLICPSTVPLRVAGYQNVSPSDGSHAAVAPCAFHGCINRQGTDDRFSFRVPEPGIFVAEVFAERLGSLLDSVIEVEDSRGRILTGIDDVDSHDSRVEFAASPEMDYSICIRDKRYQWDQRFTYRIEIAPVSHCDRVFLARREKLSQARQTIEIPSGNRVLGLFGVGHTGKSNRSELRFQDLPPHVRSSVGGQTGSSFIVPVVFDAPLIAKPTATLAGVTLIAPAANGRSNANENRFEQVVDLVNGPADAIFRLASVDRLAVAVTRATPFCVEIEQPSISLPIDGTLGLRVHVERQEGFHAPMDITFPQLPAWLDGPGKLRIESDETDGIYTLRAWPRAEPGQWPLVAEGTVGIQEARSEEENIGASDPLLGKASPLDYPVVCSSLRQLKLEVSPASATIDDVATEQGATIEVLCKFELDASAASVPPVMTATLEGLPNRVSVAPVTMKSSDRSISFRMELADDAPLGSFERVCCRLTGQLDNQAISYCVARDTRLVISPKGGSHRDEFGKPLSPLEALRKRTLSRTVENR